ncbi:MAG: ribonuclease J [Myxococcales bacterium]|nr:ribonuclease J [Myxococcales bacterium]
MTAMNEHQAVKIIPLGGLGEIGLNMLALECEGKILLIDCGLMFPEDFMLGVDIVIPDFTYLAGRSNDIVALLLTHAHEDHIGAVPYLLRHHKPVVVGSKITLAFLEYELAHSRVSGNGNGGGNGHANGNGNGFADVRMETVAAGDKRDYGPFTVEFIQVSHSIHGGFALAIRTPQGLIIHSGDFKLDFTPFDGEMTDMNRFAQFGDQGVLCMLSDSTNVEREGYTISERDIALELENIFHDCPGRIIVTLFASNLQRIQQIFDISSRFSRKIVLNGRSVVESIRIGRQLGVLKIDDDLLGDLNDLEKLDPSRIVILCTGSQGEPMSVLTRIAENNHKHIEIEAGDTVILSSKIIPGNERAVTNIINELYRKGADVVYETISKIHTSGHAYQEELKVLLRLCKPKHFIPIHGEYRQLVQHAKLAKKMGVASKNIHVLESGDSIIAVDGALRAGDRVPSGRVYVDGHGIGDVGNIVLTDRRLLSEDGTITCALAHRDGMIVSGPHFKSKGVVYEPEYAELIDEAKNLVLETMQTLRTDNAFSEEDAKQEIARAVRRLFAKRIGRRPIVIPVIMEV